MTTFNTMENDVYAVLRDSTRTFVLANEVQGWLNDAYLDIVSRTGLLRKSATGTTSTDGEVTVPSDFIRVTSFWVATDDPLTNESPEAARDDVFLSHRNNSTLIDTTLFRIFNGTIETYPEAQSRSYVLEYVYKPVAMSGGSDVPLIPEEMHTRLVAYARSQAKLKEGELAESDRYFAIYERGLPPENDSYAREHPGPTDFVPIPDYWDSEL